MALFPNTSNLSKWKKEKNWNTKNLRKVMQSLCNFFKKIFVLLLPICEATEDKIHYRGYYTPHGSLGIYFFKSIITNQTFKCKCTMPLFRQSWYGGGQERHYKNPLIRLYMVCWLLSKKTCVYDCEVLIFFLNAANFQQRIWLLQAQFQKYLDTNFI